MPLAFSGTSDQPTSISSFLNIPWEIIVTWICRLGFLIDFLSHAAVVGFMGGAAITIALQQLKGLLGIKKFTKKTDIVSVMRSVWTSVHHGVRPPPSYNLIGILFASMEKLICSSLITTVELANCSNRSRFLGFPPPCKVHRKNRSFCFSFRGFSSNFCHGRTDSDNFIIFFLKNFDWIRGKKTRNSFGCLQSLR